MAFILSKQRHSDNSDQNWVQYMGYLNSVRDRFPKNAFKIATSEWWYSFDKPEAPHDSRLINFTMSDTIEKNNQYCRITVELESAYSGRITLRYPIVEKYQLNMPGTNITRTHGDWRYDEFSLSDDGLIIHTIEWADGPDWIITASDIIHEYSP
ncbi:MAG: hypothetical protein ACOZF0_11045 [Thermodesulfobacteriota bacterium]